ncbi:MAG TPA: FKBP-type peptidyl-prolyl cis-trans isomerase [Candidatus Saccharimonadales bacterium]
MRDFLRRAMWLFVAILFVLTGVGVGIYYFWQATRGGNQNQSQPQNQLKGQPMPDFVPVAKVEGLQKIDKTVGSGTGAKASSTVAVIYTGAIASTGVVFESSQDSGQPVSFKLDQVIEGWKEGLVGMKVGGQRRLLIPASLAYGANPPPTSGIPPNADLVFDITLLAVQ